ncbi:MAG: TrpB-like pyridoxal phosphate-dependent enzyme, partial [Candidatus Micrarchaeota archaeon]
AKCVPSPSQDTKAGRDILAQHPETPGSLGIAISEAIEDAVTDPTGMTRYSLGSVLNHVMLHQTVIGQEVKMQLDKIGEKPDIMIGCVGGGSNFSGFAFPFIGEELRKKSKDIQFIAVEPESCPSLTGEKTGKSKYEYDFGDTAGMTPLLKMYTLGCNFMPSPIHAGGLRYHGMAPTVSLLYKHKAITAEAYPQEKTFEAASIFAKTEGIIPAPESSHAIASAIEHAKKCKKSGEAKTIVFNLSGHGLLDLGSYASAMGL